MKETLLKAAKEIRKTAEEFENKKFEKCAQIMRGLISMSMLSKKIKSGV